MCNALIIARGNDPEALLWAFAEELEGLAEDDFFELMDQWGGRFVPEGVGQAWYGSKEASDRIDALWAKLTQYSIGGYRLKKVSRGGAVVYGYFATRD